MRKHLLVMLAALATASTHDPKGIGQDLKKYDQKTVGIIGENDTNIYNAVIQRSRRNLDGQQAKCSGTASHWSCCTPSSPCSETEGDCDSDSECAGSLICGNNNCKSFNPMAEAAADCCVKQDPSDDYPVVVIIGDSGVGKSTFLNYIAKFDEGHPYYFKKGEDSLGFVTKDAVAKELKFRGNQSLNFIGVDTPGLGDAMGKQQDRIFMKKITKYLVENFDGKKIGMFLYVFKGDTTRYNFDSLKIYNAMFGPEFFNHLVVEVTFWKHDPFSKMQRKNSRGIDETILTKKIRDQLIKSTRIEQNVAEKVPVVFVDPVYNPQDYEGFGQLAGEVAQIQANQEENLRKEIFESPREGMICAEKCQASTDRVIKMLENDFNPVVREGNELTTFEATTMTLSCIIPIMEQDCPCFEASWSHNGSLIEPGEFNIETKEDAEGFFKTLELFHGYNTDEQTGLYQCEATTCKLGSNICATKTSGLVTVTVNELPPQIKFTSVNEIECIQEYPGKSVQVSFRIYRKDLDSHIENLVTHHFMKSEIELLVNGKKKKYFNRNTKSILRGEYFCQTQFGESKRIRVENPDVNGGWSSWSGFTACSATCGGGTRSRSRDCTAPPKLNNGMDCEGPNKQKIRCNVHACEANIELIRSVDGYQDIPLDVELEPRSWCCNPKTHICESENIMFCKDTDLITQHCFGEKCKPRAESMKITAALNEIDVDIENDCQNINIVGIHFNLKDLEREVNKPTCHSSTRKIINIKADTVTASESITLTGVETINILARIIHFNSDSTMEITFNQYPADRGYYLIQSSGEAAQHQSSKMGRYTPTIETTGGYPVFENNGNYLFVASDGYWTVGSNTSSTSGGLYHPDRRPTPNSPPLIGWKYHHNGWHKDTNLTVTHMVGDYPQPDNRVELRGSNTPIQGNVYVLNSMNQFLPVCDDIWADEHARVVCRQLGFTGGRSTNISHFGSVGSYFAMDDVKCNGNETQIQDCQYTTIDNCGAGEGAGVICRGGGMALMEWLVKQVKMGLKFI